MAASPITPPERVRATLKELATASAQQFDPIFSALQQKESTDTVIPLKEASAEVSPNLTRGQLLLCAESLEMGRLRLALSRTDFVAGIVAYMTRVSRVVIDAAQREVFADRLAAIMSIPAISYAAKTSTLALEHEHMVEDLKIFTDLRPVFQDDDLATAPEAFVLSHSLKIEYVDTDGHSKTLFVAMDDGDIQKLLESCTRALRKSEKLELLGAKIDARIVRPNVLSAEDDS